MLEVTLYAKTQVVAGDPKTTKEMLNTIASQSREQYPLANEPREDLFKDTVKWGHDSIQEFVDYTFWIKNVSRTLLAQLTRHRMASYNVLSHRHTTPNKVVVPEGVDHGYATIVSDDHTYLKWKFDSSGKFENKNYGRVEDIPLEDIRMLFPSAVTVNLFMKINGRSLRNFLKLRKSEHAQWEIRELANKIYKIVLRDCPLLVENLDPIKDIKVDLKLLIESLNVDELDPKYIANNIKEKWNL